MCSLRFCGGGRRQSDSELFSTEELRTLPGEACSVTRAEAEELSQAVRCLPNADCFKMTRLPALAPSQQAYQSVTQRYATARQLNVQTRASLTAAL
jgi:hypothetical protein